MSFLAPLWFLLGAAAAVPLLLHLLRRRTGTRAEFPAARYLLRAEREHSRSLRLRNLLLMLLRVAAILLLALAAARPSGWLPGVGGDGHAPTALALVVDNSLSSTVIDDGRPVLAAMRDEALRIADVATADDRVFVVTADGRVSGGAASVARQVLEELQPLAGAGDPAQALRRAASTAGAADPLSPAVVVLTDGQRTAWADGVDLPGGVPVAVLSPAGAAPQNRGVAVAAPRPIHWSPTGSVDVRVDGGDSAVFRVLLAPVAGEERTATRGLAAPSTLVTLRVTATDTGWLAGRVEIDRDDLPGDDTRYFAVRAGFPPGVTVASGAGPFVRSAVDVLRGTGAVRGGDDVRLLAAHELGSWRGPVLIMPPTSAAQLGPANAALARSGIPWRFGPSSAGGALRGEGLEGTSVRARYDLVPTVAAAADTLATVGGRIWAVAGTSSERRYVVIASPLEPGATDLPIRAAFVPWLAHVLTERLAGSGAGAVHAVPGGSFRPPAEADSLSLGAERRIPLAGETLTAPSQPGVYFFTRRGAAVGALVVNVEENESLLDRLQSDELAARITGTRVRSAPLSQASPALAFVGGGTRPLTGPVLLLVLVLLGTEAFVTALRGRGAA